MTQPFIVVRGLIQNLTAGKNNFKLAIITNGAWKCATKMEQLWVKSEMKKAFFINFYVRENASKYKLIIYGSLFTFEMVSVWKKS